MFTFETLWLIGVTSFIFLMLLHLAASLNLRYTHHNNILPLRINHPERKDPILLHPNLIAPDNDVHHVQQSTRMQKKGFIFADSDFDDKIVSAPQPMPSTHEDLYPASQP